MSRSMLIFSLAAELLFAQAAWAGKKGSVEKCMKDCDVLRTSAEKNCKKIAPGGKCDGRVKTMYDDLEKKCKAECEKKKNK